MNNGVGPSESSKPTNFLDALQKKKGGLKKVESSGRDTAIIDSRNGSSNSNPATVNGSFSVDALKAGKNSLKKIKISDRNITGEPGKKNLPTNSSSDVTHTEQGRTGVLTSAPLKGSQTPLPAGAANQLPPLQNGGDTAASPNPTETERPISFIQSVTRFFSNIFSVKSHPSETTNKPQGSNPPPPPPTTTTTAAPPPPPTTTAAPPPPPTTTAAPPPPPTTTAAPPPPPTTTAAPPPPPEVSMVATDKLSKIAPHPMFLTNQTSNSGSLVGIREKLSEQFNGLRDRLKYAMDQKDEKTFKIILKSIADDTLEFTTSLTKDERLLCVRIFRSELSNIKSSENMKEFYKQFGFFMPILVEGIDIKDYYSTLDYNSYFSSANDRPESQAVDNDESGSQIDDYYLSFDEEPICFDDIATYNAPDLFNDELIDSAHDLIKKSPKFDSGEEKGLTEFDKLSEELAVKESILSPKTGVSGQASSTLKPPSTEGSVGHLSSKASGIYHRVEPNNESQQPAPPPAPPAPAAPPAPPAPLAPPAPPALQRKDSKAPSFSPASQSNVTSKPQVSGSDSIATIKKSDSSQVVKIRENFVQDFNGLRSKFHQLWLDRNKSHADVLINETINEALLFLKEITEDEKTLCAKIFREKLRDIHSTDELEYFYGEINFFRPFIDVGFDGFHYYDLGITSMAGGVETPAVHNDERESESNAMFSNFDEELPYFDDVSEYNTSKFMSDDTIAETDMLTKKIPAFVSPTQYDSIDRNYLVLDDLGEMIPNIPKENLTEFEKLKKDISVIMFNEFMESISPEHLSKSRSSVSLKQHSSQYPSLKASGIYDSNQLNSYLDRVSQAFAIKVQNENSFHRFSEEIVSLQQALYHVAKKDPELEKLMESDANIATEVEKFNTETGATLRHDEAVMAFYNVQSMIQKLENNIVSQTEKFPKVDETMRDLFLLYPYLNNICTDKQLRVYLDSIIRLCITRNSKKSAATLFSTLETSPAFFKSLPESDRAKLYSAFQNRVHSR